VYDGFHDLGAPTVTSKWIASSLHVIARTVRFGFHGLEETVKLEEISYEPFVTSEGTQLCGKRR
jgi:hypothetical protein